MTLVNYKSSEISIIIFLIFTIAMMIFPKTIISQFYGVEAISAAEILSFYFISIILLLQNNTFWVIRDLTVGLLSVGYRSIGLLVNSVRSLV